MKANNPKRLAYLDWMRGLAAVIMLQGHVFHSFTRNDLRNSSAYMLTQFVGGMPPALFLFLTGVTLAFLMEGRERRGAAPGDRVVTAVRRAGYLLGIAFLFRLQMWIFGLPASPWTDLFRVDVLNSMALAVGVLSLFALVRNVTRIRLAASVGLLIAAASPFVSQAGLGNAPQILKDYLLPSYQIFGFFPWASFVAFGISAGSLLRITPQESLDRTMQWGALLGTALICGGWFASNSSLSLYPSSEFWLNSPSLILIKTGVILWLGAFSFLWNKGTAAQGWSWVRQFGTTSLLVYWVHIELVYGRWTFYLRENLGIAECALVSLIVILLMLGLSVLRTNFDRWRGWRPTFRWYAPMPDRIPGD